MHGLHTNVRVGGWGVSLLRSTADASVEGRLVLIMIGDLSGAAISF